MMNTDKLAYARSQFPHLQEGIIYLNHAAIGPLNTPVKEAMHAYVEGRGSKNIENFPDLMEVISETLQCIGNIINASPENIEFAPNTSYGLNVFAQGIRWEKGDRIIIPSCEFPANVHPFLDLEAKGVEIDFVPHHNGTFSIEDIEKLITSRTKVLSVSWVQFLSGFRCDLEELGALCRKYNMFFCVDGIQGMGALTLDVERANVDFFSTGGHKWLMATQGIGFIYASDRLFEALSPMIGWLNGPIDWENLMDYRTDLHPDARRFRLGTLNGLGITALHASLHVYKEIGPAWCENNLMHITKYLREGMEDLGFERYGSKTEKLLSGISTFSHPQSDVLFERLRDSHIYIALRNKMLRFAPGYYSASEDIDKVLAILSKSLD